MHRCWLMINPRILGFCLYLFILRESSCNKINNNDTECITNINIKIPQLSTYLGSMIIIVVTKRDDFTNEFTKKGNG